MTPAPHTRLQDPIANPLMAESQTPAHHDDSNSVRSANTAPSRTLASPVPDPSREPTVLRESNSPDHCLQQPAPGRSRWNVFKVGKPHAAVHGLPRLWTPIWLCKAPLIGFTILNIAFLVVLLILWYVSKKENGLPISPSTNHYVWTYGPTAVLVTVVAFWRQVDYYCKALLPWKEMQQGYADASRTLLLDYLSPFQVVAFWKALHQGHVVIVVTIAGFWILKLIVRTPVYIRSSLISILDDLLNGIVGAQPNADGRYSLSIYSHN
jgi:hypothetical protein